MRTHLRHAVLCTLLLLSCLSLASCGGSRAPESPEAYVVGENSAPSLDQFIGEAEGTLTQIDEPTEELPDQYTYHYAEILDTPALVELYYQQMTTEEQGFVLTDADYLVQTEGPDLSKLTGEYILVRPAVEDGKLFRLVLGWTQEGVCSVQVSCVDGAILEPEEEDPEPATLVEQIEHMYTYEPALLGLEGTSLLEYKVFPVEGIMSVDGRACRQFNIYQVRQPENVSTIVGLYLLTLDLQNLYQLDRATNMVTLLD